MNLCKRVTINRGPNCFTEAEIIYGISKFENSNGSGGIRTHAPEETGALNQRLRPLGHATDT